MTYFFRRVFLWLLQFLELQLFITLITWPLLLVWGIPLSWLSPLGNLIGNPLLSIFLCLSSLIFITELLHIPNNAIIYLLEQLHYFLQSLYSSHSYFINYSVFVTAPAPSLLLCILISCSALAVIHYKNNIHSIIRSILLCGCLIFFVNILKYYSSKKIYITYKNDKLPLIIDHNKNYLIFITKKRSHIRNHINTWITYTLQPALAYYQGAQSLEAFCIITPTAEALIMAQELCRRNIVRHIYLFVHLASRHHYIELQLCAQQYHVVVHNLDTLFPVAY